MRGGCGWWRCWPMPTDEAIASAVAAVKPDFLQLHGAETPERVAAIRGRFGYRHDQGDCRRRGSRSAASAAKYEDDADMLLFDAKAPAGAHASRRPWRARSIGRLLRGRTFARPWLLAGGLNPENVARAIRASEAPGVDVSSGVETRQA